MSCTRSATQAATLSLTRAGVASWNPRALFAAGEQGAWYDPSDLSTLFQDSAGTTPVTAVGHPVGKMLDKSGRGNHATQATTTARPTLQQDSGGRYYLQADGVDDSMLFNVGAISSGLSVFGALEWSGTGAQMMGVNNATWQRGSLYFRNSTTQRYAFASFTASSASIDFAVAAPERVVVGGIGTPSGVDRPYRNGVAGAATAAGSTSIAAQQWTLFGPQGGVGSSYSGSFYGMAMVARAMNAAEIVRLNAFLAARAGVTL